MPRGEHNLTLNEKNSMVQFLLANQVEGSVQSGKIKEAAAKWGVCLRTVHYHWCRARAQIARGDPALIIHHQLGHTKKKRKELDVTKMQAIPFEKRGTIRRLAKGLGVSKSTVGRWVQEKQIKPHTNSLHPDLTPLNKLQRVNLALSALVHDNVTSKCKFSGMYNVVHIDEKWFHMTRLVQRMYLLPEEDGPYRTCKNKRFIVKTMFMCAVSRPVYDSEGELIFDGKIGIFPFVTTEPAQRNSKNRPRGTLETKPIDSVTKQVIKECLLKQVIPAIKAKWPATMSKDIFIQQDNAKPHILNTDVEFRAAASSDGFNIMLVCQPPNSPDCNINDLGWFRAIQSLQLDTASYSVDELIENVLLSYDDLSAITLNNVFLTLQSVYVEIMKAKGLNDFKLPHMGKARLLRQDMLPEVLEVDEELVRASIQHLTEAGQIKGGYDIGVLMSDLGY